MSVRTEYYSTNVLRNKQAVMSVCTEYYSTNVLRNKQAVTSWPYRVLQY